MTDLQPGIEPTPRNAIRDQIVAFMAKRGKNVTTMREAYHRLPVVCTRDEFDEIFRETCVALESNLLAVVADDVPPPPTAPPAVVGELLNGTPLVWDDATQSIEPHAGEGEAIQLPATPGSDELPPVVREVA